MAVGSNPAPWGHRISDNHQLANVSVTKPIWFWADGKRVPPKSLEGTEEGVPKEGHPKCASEKEVVPCILILYIEDGTTPPRGCIRLVIPCFRTKMGVSDFVRPRFPLPGPCTRHPATCFPLPGWVGPDGKFDAGEFFGSTHHLNPLHPAPGRLLPIL